MSHCIVIRLPASNPVLHAVFHSDIYHADCYVGFAVPLEVAIGEWQVIRLFLPDRYDDKLFRSVDISNLDIGSTARICHCDGRKTGTENKNSRCIEPKCDLGMRIRVLLGYKMDPCLRIHIRERDCRCHQTGRNQKHRRCVSDG